MQKKEGVPLFDQDLDKIKPFEPQNQSKSAGLAQSSGLAQEFESLEVAPRQTSQSKTANYDSIYDDVNVVEDAEQQSAEAQRSGAMYNPAESLGAPATSLGIFTSFQERPRQGPSQSLSMIELPDQPQDSPGTTRASQQQKSRSGVVGNQKSGAKNSYLHEKASAEAASDGQAHGGTDRTTTPADRPMFRRK